MAWIYLFIASLLEICWLYSVKYLDFVKIRHIAWLSFDLQDLRTLAPLLGYIFFGITNVYFFGSALRMEQFSAATGFAVWMATALLGVTVIDWLVFSISLSWVQLLYLSLVVVGIIGLKISSGEIQ